MKMEPVFERNFDSKH